MEAAPHLAGILLSHNSILLFHRQGIMEKPLFLGLENPKMKISRRSGMCVRVSQGANDKMVFSFESRRADSESGTMASMFHTRCLS